jgi:hypothetical protein
MLAAAATTISIDIALLCTLHTTTHFSSATATKEPSSEAHTAVALSLE